MALIPMMMFSVRKFIFFCASRNLLCAGKATYYEAWTAMPYLFQLLFPAVVTYAPAMALSQGNRTFMKAKYMDGGQPEHETLMCTLFTA